MNFTRLYLLVILCFFCIILHGQQVTLSEKNTPLSTLIEKLRSQTGFEFVWEKHIMDNAKPVTVQLTNVSLHQALEVILQKQDISFQIISNVVLLNPAKNSSKGKQHNSLPKRKQTIADPVVQQILYGQIVTEDSVGIGMASVIIKGKDAVFSNKDGGFALHAEKGDTLRIIMAGYENQTILVGFDTTLVVKLKYLGKTIVDKYSIGYYAANAKDFNGATRPTKRTHINNDFIVPGEQEVTGVWIANNANNHPFYNNSTVINRGTSNLLNHFDAGNNLAVQLNNPLIVLDGLVQTAKNLNDIIAPHDIASISFLKDAATTAIYGSRAANGVWVVHSKKGEPGNHKVGFDMSFGFTKAPQQKFISGNELYQRQSRYLKADYAEQNTVLKGTYPTENSYLAAKLPPQEQMDNLFNWGKLILRSNTTKRIGFQMSESRTKSSYYLSGSILTKNGPYEKEDFNKSTVRFNYLNKISKKLILNTYINGVFQLAKFNASELRIHSRQLIPWASPYDKTGVLLPALAFNINGNSKNMANPIFQHLHNLNEANSQSISGIINLDWEIKSWLSFKSTNGIHFYKDEEKLRYQPASLNKISSDGADARRSYKNLAIISTQQLQVEKTFHQQKISGALGATITADKKGSHLENIILEYPQIPLVGINKQFGSLSNLLYNTPSSKIEKGNKLVQKLDATLLSMFAAAHYTLYDKYRFSASWSYDSETSAGRSAKNGHFYSIGSSWDITTEEFFKKNKKLLRTVPQLKLYINYGKIGIPSEDVFLASALNHNYAAYRNPLFVPAEAMGNQPIKWETVQDMNAGLEMGIGARWLVTIDYYNRQSKDLLQRVADPPNSTLSYSWIHGAEMKNAGLEMQILATIKDNKQFRWQAGVNGSFNKNSLTKVFQGGLQQFSSHLSPFLLEAGDAVSSIKAVRYAGVDPQTGRPQFEKLLFHPDGALMSRVLVNTVAETGVASDIRQMQTIGTLQPKLFGGLTNNLQIGKLSVAALVTFELGQVRYNAAAAQLQGTTPMEYNQINYHKGQIEWELTGQSNATEPWHYYHATTDYKGSDKYVQKANQAMLKSIQGSYPIPKKWLGAINVISDGTFYVSAYNLLHLKSRTMTTDQFAQTSLNSLLADDASSFAPWDVQKSFQIGIKIKL